MRIAVSSVLAAAATFVISVSISFLPSRLDADEWPQWRGPSHDGTWNEDDLIDKFPGERLELRWQVDIGPGYSGPTVAGGRVYLMDRQTEPVQTERVLCVSEQTGKLLWQHTYACEYRDIGYQAGPRASSWSWIRRAAWTRRCGTSCSPY